MAPDIAIVGAGLFGLALAAILERKGLDYIVYECSQRDVSPRGGCLDLHPGSGQCAMREAGVFEEFWKYLCTGDVTIYFLYNYNGEKVFEFGKGCDAPEIDSWVIWKVLLTGILEQKVVWNKAVEKAERDKTGGVLLTFIDGITATGFKLVAGADGTNSKICYLVMSVVLVYSDKLYITTKILTDSPFYPKMEEIAGKGSMIVIGKSVHMFNSCQGDGHYWVDTGLQEPESFVT